MTYFEGHEYPEKFQARTQASICPYVLPTRDRTESDSYLIHCAREQYASYTACGGQSRHQAIGGDGFQDQNQDPRYDLRPVDHDQSRYVMIEDAEHQDLGRPQRRKRVNLACKPCRRRKIKCSGDPWDGSRCAAWKRARGNLQEECASFRVRHRSSLYASCSRGPASPALYQTSQHLPPHYAAQSEALPPDVYGHTPSTHPIPNPSSGNVGSQDQRNCNASAAMAAPTINMAADLARIAPTENRPLSTRLAPFQPQPHHSIQRLPGTSQVLFIPLAKTHPDPRMQARHLPTPLRTQPPRPAAVELSSYPGVLPPAAHFESTNRLPMDGPQTRATQPTLGDQFPPFPAAGYADGGLFMHNTSSHSTMLPSSSDFPTNIASFRNTYGYTHQRANIAPLVGQELSNHCAEGGSGDNGTC